ncbi:hypothetical protein D1007_58268 [Hordeum vulgare]|nr:hypothetical protein D1007_58268 [Hordeum vulgare]
MGDVLARRLRNSGRIILVQISVGSAIPLAGVLLLALPNEPATFAHHGAALFVMGFMASWNTSATNSPILAEIVRLKACNSLYEGHVPMKYKHYCKKMKKSGEWGDHVTLQAAADKFAAKICLLTSFRDTCFVEIVPQYQAPQRDDLSPYSGVAPIVEHKVEVEANEYPQYEFGGSAPIKDDGHDSDEEYERHHNIVDDVEAQVRHDDMDPDIVYQCACVDESDDEGPVNELDEDGFTEKEAEWYTKITGMDHKVPLFCDVSLADKAIVDGGMSKTIEARMFPSSTTYATSTSYLKKGLMF